MLSMFEYEYSMDSILWSLFGQNDTTGRRRFENRARRFLRCWLCLSMSMSMESILWSVFGQNDNEEEV